MENIEYLKKQIPIMVNLFKSKRFEDLIVKECINKKISRSRLFFIT